MAKEKSTLKFEDVKKVIDATVTDPDKHAEAMTRLRRLLENKVATEKESEEKVKPKFVLLVTKPSPKGERTGWPVTVPPDMNPADVLALVHKIVYLHNDTKKGRRHPITTVGAALEVGGLSAALAKEHGLGIKCREAAWVQEITENQVPGTEGLEKKD